MLTYMNCIREGAQLSEQTIEERLKELLEKVEELEKRIKRIELEKQRKKRLRQLGFKEKK